MPKTSKNLGFSKACPECRKTIINSALLVGNGTFKTKCPHCLNIIQIEIGQKTYFTLTKVVIILAIIFFTSWSVNEIRAKKITCDTFRTYDEALLTFNSDPVKYAALDRNHDGEPCQDLK